LRTYTSSSNNNSNNHNHPTPQSHLINSVDKHLSTLLTGTV
jgi:hypothetical protein